MTYRLNPMKILLILALLMLPTMVMTAQTTDGDGTTVTDDDVNAVAKKLYCPVCENIPLDACGTAACEDWRYEIELQLEAGMSESEIIDDFVYRFGDRVVGTPQSTAPRLLSLITPWVAIAIGLFVSVQFWQNRRRSDDDADVSVSNDDSDANIATYRDLLESDVSG